MSASGVGNQMDASEGFTLQVIFENSLKMYLSTQVSAV